MRLFRNMLIAIGAAFLLSQSEELVDSDYVIGFLESNLVSLLVALLAINCASLGIVLSKIRELIDSSKGAKSFSNTRKEMLFSVKEQVVLIFLSLVLLVVNDSAWLKEHSKYVIVVQTGVISCFTYAMLILYDAAKSIFVILSFGEKK